MSNKRLFLFCIGGTGSRVLRSLTFLAASGVDLNARMVVPIIIDPDRENGDMNRTIEIIKKYQQIRKKLEFQKNKFFKTDIQTLASLEAASEKDEHLSITDGFRYEIDGTKAGKFGNFLKINQLSKVNQAFLQTLFSKENLAAELSVGFKGNPHMGSIVLNQFSKSKEFQFFASRLNEGDRVFIISSIFGGTGAAGFPLLVKNIRDAKEGIPNHDRLRNIQLGAITVMPYFGVQPDASITIDKGTFISKTKAALAYYEQHLSGNNSLNSLYYIADRITTDLPPNEGGNDQSNNAHYIELLSALSVIDFMDTPDDRLRTENGKAIDPIVKEYGLVDTANKDELTFLNFGKESRRKIAKPLIQYSYSVNYWNNQLSNALEGNNKQPYASNGLEGSFLSTSFYREDLEVFNRRFLEWLKELGRNERHFRPMQPSVGDKQLHNLVKGITQERVGFMSRKSDWGYNEFDSNLNKIDKGLPNLPREQKLLALFYLATSNIYQKRIKSQLSV